MVCRRTCGLSLRPVRDGQLRGGLGVVGEAALDGVGAEPASGAGAEHRVVGQSAAFGEPGAERCLDGAGERDGSLFAAFAVASQVGAGAEGDVAAV